MSSDLDLNPFSVQSPERIAAHDVLSLFVEDFADFHQIHRAGHTFLHGARGSGKSMIFRFLEPDCQILKKKCPLNELDFFAFYIPIKEMEVKLTELIRLEMDGHGSLPLNEHLMTVNIVLKMFASLERITQSGEPPEETTAFRNFISDTLVRLLKRGGWAGVVPEIPAEGSFEQYRLVAVSLLEEVYSEISLFIQRLSLGGCLIYTGTLLGFKDFVRPVCAALRSMPFMPATKPFFLLVDDADNFSEEQTRILNTWVSSRGTAEISLKISTQRRYKTFRTISGQSIETPHDFSEVEISDIYTSDRDRYMARVESIVERRLQLASINATPSTFFPEDHKQENEIAKIAESLRATWSESGRGFRANDDAYRYARPNFIRGLHGSSKSGSTYSYAGFKQLVHISSGVVRYFLEPAALMYGEQTAANEGSAPVTAIAPHIQNKVTREQANRFLTSEFERIVREDGNLGGGDRATKLRNLLDSLGALFSHILMSDAAERRVFSVAFSNGPDDEVREIFELGTEYNYLHKSSIGKKEGAGRTALYILSRRLAPAFGLDPTSFAGYKFITNEVARMMMLEPKKFHNRLRTNHIDSVVDPAQGRLFEEN